MRHVLRRHLPVIGLILGLAGAACDGGDNRDPESPPGPEPGETFTAADGTRFAVQVVLTGLEIPWSMAFTPDGRLFISERPGRVRVVQNNQLVSTPALSLSDIAATGESGAMGLAVHPQFATNRFVYLCYTARAGGGGMVNRVVRYREVGNTFGEAAVLLDNIAASAIHDGCRLRFGPDGKLYISMGDAASPPLAQDLASLNGKILRMNDDGSVPGDNPLSSFLFSYGHRNPQGIDFHPTTGELWETEHGQTGNDELNRIQAGLNYGWPVIEANRTQAGMETPVLFYDPAIAPSGMAFYTGSAIEAFRGNIFFATLRGQHLHRVRLDPADPRRVLGEERLLENRFGRIRDVVSGPDGFLYFCTNNRDGRGNTIAEDDRVVRIIAAAR